MKVFFGIDITHNKKNTQFDGEVFLCEQVSADTEKILDSEMEAMHKISDKATPRPLRIAYMVFMLVAVFCMVLILKAWGDFTFAEIFQKMPFAFYLGIGSAVLWGLTYILIRKRAKTVLESDEAVLAMNRSDTIAKNALSTLGVPPTAPQTDILLSGYKNRNGKILIPAQTFDNAELYVFAENGTLYLADCYKKYGIPLAEIRGIQTVDKRIRMNQWNKETPYNQEPYKAYKIRQDQGQYFVKPYYALEILHGGETYLLYFPPYELPVFEQILQNQSI